MRTHDREAKGDFSPAASWDSGDSRAPPSRVVAVRRTQGQQGARFQQEATNGPSDERTRRRGPAQREAGAYTWRESCSLARSLYCGRRCSHVFRAGRAVAHQASLCKLGNGGGRNVGGARGRLRRPRRGVSVLRRPRPRSGAGPRDSGRRGPVARCAGRQLPSEPLRMAVQWMVLAVWPVTWTSTALPLRASTASQAAFPSFWS